MNDSIFLETDRLLLCKLTYKYCTQEYINWLHDPEVNKFMESGKYPETKESLETFIDSVNQKENLFLAIVEKESKRHIGNIKIDSINRFNQTAEYAIMIGDKEAWGKGLAKEASDIVINHCWNALNIRKLKLGLISGNQVASRLYEKMGFDKEAVLKKEVFSNGEYVDVIRMAIFRD